MKMFIAMAAGLAITAGAMAQNTGARITDGGTTFDYTASGTGALPTASGSGGNVTMYYGIGGAVPTAGRQVFSGNWYYRLGGDTRERHFANAVTRTLTGTNQVDWTFDSIRGAGDVAAPGVTGAMGFTTNNTGPNSGLLTGRASITNGGSTPLNLDLFFALDIDLGGTFPGDAYAPLDTSGGSRTWTATDAAAAGGPWTSIFQGVGAHGAGVGGFTAINSQMTDTSVDNFIPDLNAGGLAAADNAALMQWRVEIQPGQTFSAVGYLGIGGNGVIPAIPAPGSLALLGLGGLLAARRRRA